MKRLTFTASPGNVSELQSIPHIRIFIFEQTGGHLIIDFTAHRIEQDCLYIVPPQHYYQLHPDNAGHFICVDIDSSLLKSYHKKLLYGIKYSKYKSLAALNRPGDDCSYRSAALLSQHAYNERYITTILEHWIERRVSANVVVKQQERSYNHIEMADRFLGLLAGRKLTLQSCKVSALAAAMFCSERTLHRTCMSVFGICAREVIHYHFRQKAIFLLTDPRLSFNDIAAELEFSGITSFNHFIKNATGFTPSYIREVLQAGSLRG